MIRVFDQKQDCCGCTACSSICPSEAIRMLPDEEGFVYPEIDPDACIDCRLCKDVCAFQNGYNTSNNLDTPDVYAVKHQSDEVRQISASGGAFTAISDYILSKRGVIYGVAFAENFRLLHQRAETKKERDLFCGSKYIQSELGDVFKQIANDLTAGRHVLFTGTSCQVGGLNEFLKKKNINRDLLLTADILCFGTPSLKVFRDFIAYLGKKKKSKVIHYSFRSKVLGWGHTEKAQFEDGTVDYTSTLSQAYKYLFHSRICLRPSCYQCKYANFMRPGDITLGDFWGIEKYHPEFTDKLGVSLVILNTQKARNVYSALSGIDCVKSNMRECAEKQKRFSRAAEINPKRDAFWGDYKKYGFDYIIKKYTNYGCQNKRVKWILLKLQTYKRRANGDHD